MDILKKIFSLTAHFLGFFDPNTKHDGINGKPFSNRNEYIYSISMQSALTVIFSRQQQNIIPVSFFQIKSKITINYTNCQNKAKPTI